MPRWTVHLDGASSSLRLLAALAVGVTVEDRAFVFRSENLDRLTDSTEVEQYVGELIGVLNGVGRMADDDFVAISSSLIVGTDRGHTTVLARPADAAMRGGVAVVQQGSQSGVSTDYSSLAEIAIREPKVAQVLQTLARGVDPVNLYRVFELIRNDVRPGMVTNGWTTKPEIERFRRTVNSVSVLGYEARHAVQREQPPQRPMSVAEARAFVRRLVEKWAASK